MAKLKCSLVHAGCKFEAPTGKSWKIHATRAHGGYKESEYLALVGQSSSLPAAAGFDKAPTVTETPAAEAPCSPSAAGVNLGDELNQTMERAASVMAEITVKILEQYAGLKDVTAADKQTIAEGWKAPAKILNFRSEIQPVEKTVRSPLWALLFPLFSILVVVVSRGNLSELFKLFAEEQSNRGGDRSEGKRKNDAGGATDSGTPPAP
ncbi:MAG: hypothetical protein KGJ13_06090 [Patescibacteria group bacterium]|nr:hypothetical protein [Patescibacteria group bacterium]